MYCVLGICRYLKNRIEHMSYGARLVMFSRWVSWPPPSDSVRSPGWEAIREREASVVHAVFFAVCVVIFFLFFLIPPAMMKQTVPMSEITSCPLEIAPAHFH